MVERLWKLHESMVNNLKEPDDGFVIRRLISQMMATSLLSGARFDDEETRIRYSQKDTSDRTMPDHAKTEPEAIHRAL